MNPILLSICIPTFNRPKELEISLISIARTSNYHNRTDVQIVITDNSDNNYTYECIKKLSKKIPRIKYRKNASNNGVLNLLTSIEIADGTFRKLANDTIIWTEISLSILLKHIEHNYNEKKPIYIDNTSSEFLDPQEITSLEDFVKLSSINSTWMGGFGIWDNKIDQFTNIFLEKKSEMIPHTYYLFHQLYNKNSITFLSGPYFKSQYGGRKGTYSLPEIFGGNYLGYLREFGVSSDTIQSETEASFRHILHYYFNKNYDFYKKEFYEHLEVYCQLKNFKERILFSRNNFLKEINYDIKIDKQKIWRFFNRHNETIISRDSDINKVLVGNYSYGPINIKSWGTDNEALFIGNFVSIAENVTFILGGNHAYDSLSTFPFKVKFFNKELEAESKGPITIHDDVWIGWGSTILSGVTVGQGAILAAGCLVTKDVPPYAVVGGNPAKILKYRFTNNIIEKLCAINFYKFNKGNITKIKEYFEIKIGDKNVGDIVDALSNVKKFKKQDTLLP